MQRLNKIIAWIGLVALALPAMAQEKHAFSIQQALDYAKKNNEPEKEQAFNIFILRNVVPKLTTNSEKFFFLIVKIFLYLIFQNVCFIFINKMIYA